MVEPDDVRLENFRGGLRQGPRGSGPPAYSIMRSHV